jgi:hypothetical protein
MTRARNAMAVAFMIGALAACSTQAPGGSSSPAFSALPSAAVGSSPPAASSGLPSLEALIPDQIRGMTLQKTSMKGADFLSSSDADPASVAFLQGLGVSPTDIGVAFGYGFDSGTNAGFAMFVFQAAGADESRLVSVFTSASSQGRTTPLDWQAASVGGKNVRVAADSEEQGIKLYLYAHADVLFVLSGTAQDLVSDALARLP